MLSVTKNRWSLLLFSLIRRSLSLPFSKYLNFSSNREQRSRVRQFFSFISRKSSQRSSFSETRKQLHLLIDDERIFILFKLVFVYHFFEKYSSSEIRAPKNLMLLKEGCWKIGLNGDGIVEMSFGKIFILSLREKKIFHYTRFLLLNSRGKTTSRIYTLFER